MRNVSMSNSESSDVISTTVQGISLDALHGEIQDFLDRGMNKSTMVIKNDQSEYVIRFEKYISREKKYGIVFLSDNNRNFLYRKEELVNICMKFGISYDYQEYLIQIDCGENHSGAYNIVKFVCGRIFYLPSETQFDVHINRMSRWRDVISSPNQRPASKDKGRVLVKEWVKKGTGTNIVGLLAFVFLMISQAVGAVGLASVLLLNVGEWRYIDLRIFQAVFRIPVVGLICVIIITFSYLAIFFPPYWRVPTGNRAEGMRPHSMTLGEMFFDFCRRPMNWVIFVLLAWALYTWGAGDNL